MRTLQQLFGPRIETRFVSTISLIVAIALVSLIVVVHAEIDKLRRNALEVEVALLARLAQETYPRRVSPSGLPPTVVQVTTLGSAGEITTVLPGAVRPLELTRAPTTPGASSTWVDGHEMLVFSVPPGGPEHDRSTWVVCSSEDLAWQRWLVLGRIVLVGSAILISCYFLGIFLARTLLGPLARFTAALDRVGRGNLEPVLVPEAPENFGQFQQAFNVMLEQIRKNREMERALLARDKMATVGQLAAAVAHETRNPLAAISSLTQMVAEEVRENPRLREYTKVVLKEVARLDKNITHLLDYARPMRAHFELTRVDQLIRDVIVLLGFEARRQGTRLVARIPEEDAGEGAETARRWLLDGNQVKQVLVNLVANAIRASDVGGTVTVAYQTAPQGGLRLTVEDQGEGVPEGLRNRVFQPFFSATKGGTGLGLAVAHRIVEEHCGRIWVEDGEGGRGARFVVHLPELEAPPEGHDEDLPQGPSPWPSRRRAAPPEGEEAGEGEET